MRDHQDEITIRMLSEEDREGVVRLAQLDTSTPPEGNVMGAIVDGRLVAAISLETGESVANPFIPSDGAHSMLQLRARQLSPRRGRILPRRRRARGSLGAQPAGAGGRMLAFERRV